MVTWSTMMRWTMVWGTIVGRTVVRGTVVVTTSALVHPGAALLALRDWLGVQPVFWLARAVVVGACLIDGIRVESSLGDDVIFEEGPKVLATVRGEEEGVDAGTKLAPCEVARCKKCSTLVLGRVILIKKTGLSKCKLESAELGGEEVDDLE